MTGLPFLIMKLLHRLDLIHLITILNRMTHQNLVESKLRLAMTVLIWPYIQVNFVQNFKLIIICV